MVAVPAREGGSRMAIIVITANVRIWERIRLASGRFIRIVNLFHGVGADDRSCAHIESMSTFSRLPFRRSTQR